MHAAHDVNDMDVENAPLLEDIGRPGGNQIAHENEDPNDNIEMAQVGVITIPKRACKSIRMLNSDGSIYEMVDDIVLPEGWDSDSD